ncbi:MAG: hypothetical protein ACXAEU_21535 [Candidatus Hodarchaeales archaeon]|jgi:hypothetical protein
MGIFAYTIQLLPAIISIIIVLFTYRSAKKTTIYGREILFKRYTFFGSAMLSMWFLSFIFPFFILPMILPPSLTGHTYQDWYATITAQPPPPPSFIPRDITSLVSLIGDSIGCFVAYYLLKKAKPEADESRYFSEILFLGLAILAVGVIYELFLQWLLRALLLPDSDFIVDLIKSVIIVACFIISSSISYKKASRILEGKSGK